MAVTQDEIKQIVDGYDTSQLTVATAQHHSARQILHGLKKEGIDRRLVLAMPDRVAFYKSLKYTSQGLEVFSVPDWNAVLAEETQQRLREANTVVIPHASLMEYIKYGFSTNFHVPIVGNRRSLDWEATREKQREWLEKHARVPMPALVTSPDKIDRPVLVKFDGAKGGDGYFIARDKDDYYAKMGNRFGSDTASWPKPSIQEFLIGTRYYLHFFHTPLNRDGYHEGLEEGSIELLGVDRRDELIDEASRLGGTAALKELKIEPSFEVTGNVPIVMRESLLPPIYDMAARTVQASYDLFGGMKGPFCLEGVVTKDEKGRLNYKVFEVSARIVAGTNAWTTGSPESEILYGRPVSMAQRIAMDLKEAREAKRLQDVVS